MRLSITAALMALLVFSACQTGDSADNAPIDTTESDSSERTVGDDDTMVGDTSGTETAEAVTEGTCETERAQDIPSPGACASIALGSSTLEVQYSSPSMKGRQVFGGLVPNGEVWRTGANEATVFNTDGPLTIGGEVLPAGSYGLFTIPGETEWTIIFNSVSDQWGAFEYDEGQDVLRTMAASGIEDAPKEQFSISFEPVSDTDTVMVLTWDDVRVSVDTTKEALEGRPEYVE